jgi:diamine N-acetyltransferase
MMDAVSVRRCVVGDAVALSIVGQASFLEAFAGTISGNDIIGHCVRQHSVENYETYLRDPATTVWLAEATSGQAPVGYLVLTTPDLPLPDITAHDAEVKRIYLLHRFQGGGLGARLMHEAQSFAAAQGILRLLLGVYSRNTAAISFYERLGYRRVGTRQFKVGDNAYDDLIMALAIG